MSKEYRNIQRCHTVPLSREIDLSIQGKLLCGAFFVERVRRPSIVLDYALVAIGGFLVLIRSCVRS